jgi:hypothetical protein
VVRRRFEQEGASDREESLKRRSQWLGFVKELAKSHQPPDLGEVAQDLHLRRREKPRAIGIRLVGVCRGRSLCLLKSRLAISRRNWSR